MHVLDGVKPETVIGILNAGSLVKARLSPEKVRPDSAELSRELRRYVDEWLESGRRGGGLDLPFERSVDDTTTCGAAVAKYLEKYPPIITFYKNLGLVVKVNAPDDSTSDWQAKSYFATMLMNDWRNWLGRCAVCKKYFVRKLKRKAYKNGLSCSPEHNKRQTAIKATNQRRVGIESRLIDRAARFLLRRRTRTGEWMRRQNTKKALAESVRSYVLRSRNQDLVTYRKGVRFSVHWATRHQQKIEERRQRPAAAKHASVFAAVTVDKLKTGHFR